MEEIDADASFCYPLPDGTIAVAFRINTTDAGTITAYPDVLRKVFNGAIRSIGIIERKIAESK